MNDLAKSLIYETSYSDQQICIEIAAYEDPELLATVFSAVRQADHAERVHFAICYQSDDLHDLHSLRAIKNCRVTHLTQAQSRGTCYARHCCQKLIKDTDDFVFQMDSHMRFVKHWDTLILKQWYELNDKKGILSVYPPNYNDSNHADKSIFDPAYDTPAAGCGMICRFFRPDSYFISFLSHSFNNTMKPGARNAFIAAGYMFAPAELHRTILHDPDMFFCGDELPMAIRYFTHGYNIYNPPQCYVYHQYHRPNRKMTKAPDVAESEKRRLMTLLDVIPECEKVDLGEYGLGTERTLHDFEVFAGVDFKQKLLYLRAQNGDHSSEAIDANKITYLQLQEQKRMARINENNMIIVLMVDYDGKYDIAAEHCLARAADKDNIAIVVVTTHDLSLSEQRKKELHIQTVIPCRLSESYGTIANKGIEYIAHIGSTYTAVVDSSLRYIQDWDKYYVNNICFLGGQSVITSWVYHKYPSDKGADIPYTSRYNIISGIRNGKFDLKIMQLDANSVRGHICKSLFPKFMFIRTSVLCSIKFNEFDYLNHLAAYSMRLWTHGYDIYSTQTSYVYETDGMTDTSSIEVAHAESKAMNILGIMDYYRDAICGDIDDGVGDVRPVEVFYNDIPVKYDPLAKTII